MQLIQVERGTTLYLALENVQRRLKERIGKMLEFDPWMFGWKIAGKAVDVKSTDEKQKLFDCLKEAGGPLTPKQIEDKTGLRNNYIQKTLPALLKEGRNDTKTQKRAVPIYRYWE